MCVLSSRCSLHLNRQMAHGLQMAEIAQYKKRKAEKQQQEQLAKKKNWGNVMHYKKMYNITGLVGNVTHHWANICWGMNCLSAVCLHSTASSMWHLQSYTRILATAWSSLSYKWESGTIALWAFQNKGPSQHVCSPTSCWAVAGVCLLILKMVLCQKPPCNYFGHYQIAMVTHSWVGNP